MKTTESRGPKLSEKELRRLQRKLTSSRLYPQLGETQRLDRIYKELGLNYEILRQPESRKREKEERCAE